jgi:hypothetical protein
MHCEKCGAVWDEPAVLWSVPTEEIAALFRTAGALKTAARLRETGASLHDAKAIAFHITAEPGVCHRCRADLRGRSRCSKCQSFNYDW